ncbi:Riboflavin kinase [Cladophialophora carrionii]|uniref:Riboflavin kinase n=1 Tax=Cladophialophora carrionii TaxID=86049 RepID=A0A1C1CD26_9EURO|nr:Riboflavin kinase [Cladophialophora carrionii]
MRPDGPRDPYAGPESGPETPFPIKLSGPVIKGFGRGSKELGIPTANIPPEGLAAYPDLPSGVYYGFVGLSLSPSPDTTSTSIEIHPAVLSIGYNPFYKNTVRSVEIHILHEFTHDFYGAALNLLVLGYIRPEYDYVSLEALVDDIKIDCDVARRSLDREAYATYKQDGEWRAWLTDFKWMESVDTKQVEKEVLNKD